MPVLLKILFSLALILVIQRIGKNLLAAIAAGTLLLAFWAGHTPFSFLNVVRASYFSGQSLDNYMLLVIVLQVIWLSSQLAVTGVMNDLTRVVTGVFSKRTAMAVLPALIGILPMPGGALFSAPLVDDCDKNSEIDPLLKTEINFWFRHIWEYWWPLYPGVILAIDITGLEPSLFMAVMFPLSLFSVVIGYFFFLRNVPADDKSGSRRYRDLLLPLLPVGILLAVYTVVQLFFPVVQTMSRYLPMSIGIMAAMAGQQMLRPLPIRKWISIISSPKAFVMVGIVAVIRLYGIVIEAPLPGGDYLIAQLRTELATAGIPPLLLVILLPFVASLTSGIAVGYVGASLPIVMQLTGTDAPASRIVATAVLAYGSGYIALLLSPVHVCLIVTNEHFKTGLPASIRKMLPPAAVLFGAVCLWAFLIGKLF